jgi:hypothetical protein
LTYIINLGVILEIIGFLLILNSSRKPVPPKRNDIRSNISYLESVSSTAHLWVKHLGVGVMITGVVMQSIYSLYL